MTPVENIEDSNPEVASDSVAEPPGSESGPDLTPGEVLETPVPEIPDHSMLPAPGPAAGVQDEVVVPTSTSSAAPDVTPGVEIEPEHDSRNTPSALNPKSESQDSGPVSDLPQVEVKESDTASQKVEKTETVADTVQIQIQEYVPESARPVARKAPGGKTPQSIILALPALPNLKQPEISEAGEGAKQGEKDAITKEAELPLPAGVAPDDVATPQTEVADTLAPAGKVADADNDDVATAGEVVLKAVVPEKLIQKESTKRKGGEGT